MGTDRHTLARALFVAACLAVPGGLAAQGAGAFPVPDRETLDPPTPSRIEAVLEMASSSGPASVVGPLREAAVRAYSHERFAAAEAWYHLFRWEILFAEPENVFVDGWIDAVRAAQLNYEGVAGEYHPSKEPIGAGVSAGLHRWLLSNEAFSEEFFTEVRNVDHVPNMLVILEGLRRRDPARFDRYPSLALAIAMVYDVPPPPYWPHIQVAKGLLSRKLPSPEEAFGRLAGEEARGRTYFRLEGLRADELKFVVDTAAPAPELAWSEANVPYSLDQFENAYFMVKYRTDRASSEAMMTWTGAPYTLQAIKEAGGICIDQAYFAAEAGKARGVPTLLFFGAGQDGRHAWFGYLDASRKWRLDAGRYAEQRLVTGIAIDPQTWSPISDHELQFLSERFRALPAFAQSRVHQEFASDFLRMGDAAEAARAARKAVNYERRNLDAWETLIAANERLGVDPARQESVYREAALAFSPRYPDLVVGYVERVCKSLRARGETSLADYEERGLADRLKGDRADLAIRQASAILARSMATQSVQDQIATYNAILAQFGHGAGTLFFDQIVAAFAEHLAVLHLRPQAREAVERAREALEVQPGTQFSMDVDKLMGRLGD